MKAKIYQSVDKTWRAHVYSTNMDIYLSSAFTTVQEAFDWVWKFDIEELIVWK